MKGGLKIVTNKWKTNILLMLDISEMFVYICMLLLVNFSDLNIKCHRL
jgi:hypothetical protein